MPKKHLIVDAEQAAVSEDERLIVIDLVGGLVHGIKTNIADLEGVRLLVLASPKDSHRDPEEIVVDATVLTGEYENEPCELVVAATAEAGAVALSHHRLNQIRPRLQELTAQDRDSLVELLQMPAG
jgi:hypothetical protein